MPSDTASAGETPVFGRCVLRHFRQFGPGASGCGYRRPHRRHV